MSDLANKIALVTGASSGVGRATARLMAREGARVVLGARRGAELATLAAEIEEDGGTAAWLAGDVADEDYAAALVALALERFGGLDIAFNNAGTLGALGPVTSLSVEDWERTLAVNLTGGFLGAKHQIPAMIARGGGSLIFTSTFVGFASGFAGMAAYAAAKAGLVGLTRVLAVEHGGEGIRVNALLPGGVDTPMGREAAPTPEARAAVGGLHALGRLAEAREIAEAALFLASDRSSFMTGTALLVDGGVSIRKV